MNLINDNANIFFFVTTIFVSVLVLTAAVVLVISIKIYRFIQRFIANAEALIEDNKTNEFVKRAVPIILPILGFFFKKGKKTGKRK
jgi:heme/copper-type cytochrome/quinol oxidase subunit 2